MKLWRVMLADGSVWPVMARTAYDAVVHGKVIGVEPA
jgi:hypothetical protein